MLHFLDIPAWQTQICFGHIHLNNHWKQKKGWSPLALGTAAIYAAHFPLTAVWTVFFLGARVLDSAGCLRFAGIAPGPFPLGLYKLFLFHWQDYTHLQTAGTLTPCHELFPKILLGQDRVSKHRGWSPFLFQSRCDGASARRAPPPLYRMPHVRSREPSSRWPFGCHTAWFIH